MWARAGRSYGEPVSIPEEEPWDFWRLVHTKGCLYAIVLMIVFAFGAWWVFNGLFPDASDETPPPAVTTSTTKAPASTTTGPGSSTAKPGAPAQPGSTAVPGGR